MCTCQHIEGCEIGGKNPELYGMKTGNKIDGYLKPIIILILVGAKNILVLIHHTIYNDVYYSNAQFRGEKEESVRDFLVVLKQSSLER